MAASTFGRYSYHRSNTGAQVANNQQSGLGKSVSLNWKFEIANDKWALYNTYPSVGHHNRKWNTHLSHQFQPYTWWNLLNNYEFPLIITCYEFNSVRNVTSRNYHGIGLSVGNTVRPLLWKRVTTRTADTYCIIIERV